MAKTPGGGDRVIPSKPAPPSPLRRPPSSGSGQRRGLWTFLLVVAGIFFFLGTFTTAGALALAAVSKPPAGTGAHIFAAVIAVLVSLVAPIALAVRFTRVQKAQGSATLRTRWRIVFLFNLFVFVAMGALAP